MGLHGPLREPLGKAPGAAFLGTTLMSLVLCSGRVSLSFEDELELCFLVFFQENPQLLVLESVSLAGSEGLSGKVCCEGDLTGFGTGESQGAKLGSGSEGPVGRVHLHTSWLWGLSQLSEAL